MKFYFQEEIIEVAISSGETILEVAQKAKLLTMAECGGRGTCGKCRVELLSENENGPAYTECLACLVRAEESMIVRIPYVSERSDDKKTHVTLPERFKPNQNRPDIKRYPYGISVDLGTTTVVAMLWDLKNSSLMGASSKTNPQSAHGADVISRISYAIDAPKHLEILQREILTCITELITELATKSAIDLLQIGRIFVVGNATMSHLLLGVDPKGLAIAPFQPAFTGTVQKNASDLGLPMHQDAMLTLLPNIAGHVGSDTVAALIATELSKQEGVSLLIDVGTNGEIVLCAQDRLVCCSTAAGPAFEGASIHQGMRATYGAINSVHVVNHDLSITTIGDGEPVGICGSGLIDGVAALLELGLLTNTGKLIKTNENETGVLLYRGSDFEHSVAITQKDIREVQLAKGAILAGINILLMELNLTADEIDQIFLAGAFGNDIDVNSAIKIGLLPNISPQKIHSVGNAAGVGACMALLSDIAMEEAITLSQTVLHVELANHPEFQEHFLKAMYFE